MTESGEKFWVDDPSVLITNIRLFPLASMTKDEKLNALTRLGILIGGVLYFMNNEHWFTFIILSMLVVLLMKYAGKPENFSPPSHDSKDGETQIENFTLTPTYSSPDMSLTTIAPLFSEEWQILPPAYDLYVNTPPDVSFAEPLTPANFPYGQYLTTTNLLPSDEQATRMFNGGPKQARSYINSAFTRHTMAYRDNMTKLYKKKLARRFRATNCNDSFSPFHSY